MAKLNEEGLKKQIKEGSFSNAYMLYGTENYLKDLYLSRLKKKLINPAFADFNYHAFEGRDVSIDDIILAAQTVPMMSEYSLIVVHDFPFDENKEAVKALKEFLSDMPDYCITVFWYESIVIETKKDSPWKGVISAFTKAGSAVEINERTVGELIKLLCAYASKRGCNLERNNASYLIEVSGQNLQTLFNELDKICSYVKSGEITREHINSLATKTLQAKIFDISKFIIQGNSDLAYNGIFALLYQKEEAKSILSAIASYYVDMYRVKCAKEAGKVPADVAQHYNYGNRDWILSKAAADSSKISLNSLREALDILANADFQIKSNAAQPDIILEEAVAKLLMLRNKYE